VPSWKSANRSFVVGDRRVGRSSGLARFAIILIATMSAAIHSEPQFAYGCAKAATDLPRN
jgi:hypothetical protein